MSKKCVPRCFIEPSHIPLHLLLFKISPEISLNSCIIRNVSLTDCTFSTKIVVSSAYCVNKICLFDIEIPFMFLLVLKPLANIVTVGLPV